MKYCIHCGEQIQDDAQFCTCCGRSQIWIQETKRPSFLEDVRSIVRTVSSGVSLIMFILGIACLALLYIGIPDIIDVWDHSVSIFIILDGAVTIGHVNGILFFYLFFIAVTAVSFILLIKNSMQFRKEISMKTVEEHSPLYTIGTMIMALLFLTAVVQVIIPYLLGTSSASLDVSGYTYWQLLYSAAEPPVYEEIISRILLIGIPLLAVDCVLHASINSEIKPLRKYILGGGFKIGTKELIFILISAMMFGYAHMGSWDAFKILPSACMGIAAGYLFLKHGIWACISLHAINNFISYLIMLTDSYSLTILVAVLELPMIVLGAAYFISYTIKSARWFHKKYVRKEEV